MGIMRIGKTTPPPTPIPSHICCTCEIRMFHHADQDFIGTSTYWILFLKVSTRKQFCFHPVLKKSTHGLSIFCHEHFIPQDQNIAYLYFVAHISHIFSSENLLFSPKVTPR